VAEWQTRWIQNLTRGPEAFNEFLGFFRAFSDKTANSQNAEVVSGGQPWPVVAVGVHPLFTHRGYHSDWLIYAHTTRGEIQMGGFVDGKPFIPLPDPNNSAGRLFAFLEILSKNGNLPDAAAIALSKEASGAGDAMPREAKPRTSFEALREAHRLYMDFRGDMLDAQMTDRQRQLFRDGLDSLEEIIYPRNVR
jgi:hypothetical protein